MAGFAGPNIIEDGIVLCLDADNTKSYPVSGTTWTDLSGKGNDATLQYGPTYNSDNGGYFIFDGINDQATISNASALGGFSGDFTIEFWFKGGQQQNYAVFLENHSGGPESHRKWAIQAESDGSTGNMIWVRNGVDGIAAIKFTTSGIDSFDNDWHQHVVVRNGSTINYYIDKVSRGSESYSGTLSAGTKLAIGEFSLGSNPGQNYHIGGNMSAIRIYNGKGFTAAEVLQNYNAFRGRY